jgi:transposase-like protein
MAVAESGRKGYFAGMGRPTNYTKELGDEICARIAEDEGVAAICRDERMPSRVTIYRWLREHSEFSDNYAHARLDQGHTAADEMRETRRKVESGVLDPAAARVITDALKWEAGRRNPKAYGDKQTLEHSGTVGVHTLSDEELEKRIRELGGA